MKLFTQYTTAHEILFTEFFRPSLPANIELSAQLIPSPGAGDFYSPEWHSCVEGKIHILIQAIRENMHEQIIWSDVDIQFFEFLPERLATIFEGSGKDVLFQREEKSGIRDVNTGFFICNANEPMLNFLTTVASLLATEKAPNDQHTINHLLRKGAPLSWGVLPNEYYARTHGFPPPRHIALYHANGTTEPPSVRRKCQQLKRIDYMMRSPLCYARGILAEGRNRGIAVILRSFWRRYGI